jgi:hypothetical protein
MQVRVLPGAMREDERREFQKEYATVFASMVLGNIELGFYGIDRIAIA